jgi:hypothetical protein
MAESTSSSVVDPSINSDKTHVIKPQTKAETTAHRPGEAAIKQQ